MTYVTTADLNSYMGLRKDIPDRLGIGTEKLPEEIGTGDGVTLIFFTDYASVIAGTYVFYYGTSPTAALSTPLTETTHYTFVKETGMLTLTVAGRTLVTTNKIYAVYSYNAVFINDIEMQNSLDRAEEELERELHCSYVDSSVATPDWGVATNEKQSGKGNFNTDYFLENSPIPNISTTLNGAVLVSAISITVVSTAGFPSSGYIAVEDNKIAYTGKGATSFTGCTGVTAHDTGKTVYPYVIEISTTEPGSEPSWEVLTPGDEYDLDLNIGRVHVYSFGNTVSSYSLSASPDGVPNRFRATYIYGKSTIPSDIKRVELMIASRDLLHMAVRKAHSMGMNNFTPSMIDVDEVWILQTYARYRNIQMGNT